MIWKKTQKNKDVVTRNLAMDCFSHSWRDFIYFLETSVGKSEVTCRENPVIFLLLTSEHNRRNNKELCRGERTDAVFRRRSRWWQESMEWWEKYTHLQYKMIHNWVTDTGWDWWWCKKSKICSEMRLKPYQDPRLPQITVLYLLKTFLKIDFRFS